MKIIGTDNHARDWISDRLWIDNIPDECKEFAQRVCDRLNIGLGDGPGKHYKLVPDDHKLFVGDEF